MDPQYWKYSTFGVLLLFILCIILTLTNTFCSPFDLCYKSEIGWTCYEAKKRTVQLVSELKK
jgi:hypothetical protein